MRKILSRAALAAIVILISNGLLIGPANASESSILEPASGALLGHYYGAGSIAQTTAKLGRTPPLHLTYYAWTDAWTVTDWEPVAGELLFRTLSLRIRRLATILRCAICWFF